MTEKIFEKPRGLALMILGKILFNSLLMSFSKTSIRTLLCHTVGHLGKKAPFILCEKIFVKLVFFLGHLTQQFRKKLFACEEKWVFKDLYALEKRKIQTTYKDNLDYTKWKLKDLSVTQILCEINCREFGSCKMPFLPFQGFWILFFGIFQPLIVQKFIKIKNQSI